MAKRNIKGITIEIDGNATPLQKALGEVDKSLKTTQNQLKDVNKLLKFDPGNSELLQQKQKALAGSIQETKDRLNQLKDAQKAAQEQLANGDIGQDQYDTLQREIIETEQNLKNLEKEYKDFGSVAKQQIQAVGDKMQEVGGKVQDFGKKITDAGKSMSMKVTAPLAAIGTVGVKSFAEVDKTMQLTYKTMGTTEKEAEMLSKSMKEAASNSTFGMNDAATATLNFARAGLDAKESAAALAPAMNLAAGEGGDLDTVSAGLVATINSFGDSFNKTGEYADIFAAACNNSALDVNSLSEAMSIAAPIFSAAGYSVKDASLYMGVMADAGIDANKAATSLKTGLARLVSPSKEGATALEELGISVTNADGSMKDSVQIQQELHDAFAKLSESEQLAAASAIFGKNQMAPWLALINTAPKDVQELDTELEGASFSIDDFSENLKKSGKSIDDMKKNFEKLGVSGEDFDDILKMSGGTAEGFADMLWEAAEQGVSFEDVVNALGGDLNSLDEIMQQTRGTTDEMAEAMMSGFGGSMEKLKSTLDVLTTNIGEALAPTIQKVTDIIQTLADKFNALSPQQQETIVKIGLLVAAIGPLLVVIGTVVSAIGTIISGAGAVVGALGLLLSPIGLVVAAIAALIAIGVLLYKNWDEIKQMAEEIWGAIKEFVTNVVTNIHDNIVNYFTQVRDFWANVWETIKDKAVTAVTTIKDNIVNYFTQVYDFWTGVWDKVKNFFSDTWDKIKEGASQKAGAVKDAITGAIGGALDWLASLPGRAYQWGLDLIDNFIAGIQRMLGPFWDVIAGAAGIVSDLLGFSEPKEGPLSNFHTYAPDMLKLFAEGIEKNKRVVYSAMDDLAEGMNITGSADMQINSDSLAVNPNMNGITAMLSQYLPYLAQDQNIYLDSGALVGGTAGAMNRALGQIQVRERRR